MSSAPTFGSAAARDLLIAGLVTGCLLTAALLLYAGWWILLLNLPSVLLVADLCLVVAWLVRRYGRQGSGHE